MKSRRYFLILLAATSAIAGGVYVNPRVPAVQKPGNLWMVTCPVCGTIITSTASRIGPPQGGVSASIGGNPPADKIFNHWIEQRCPVCSNIVVSVWSNTVTNDNPVWN